MYSQYPFNAELLEIAFNGYENVECEYIYIPSENDERILYFIEEKFANLRKVYYINSLDEDDIVDEIYDIIHLM